MTNNRLIALFFFATATALAQRYPFLPVSNSPHGIYAMAQDSKSQLWLGTIDDVFCFDGTHFYSLRTHGFPRETPNAFAEDSDGGIWIATQGTANAGGTRHGGLYRYQAGQVQKIFAGDGLSVLSIAPGIILASFGTEAVGRPMYGDLYRFRKSAKAWNPELLKKASVNHMTLDKAGSVLFPCPGGWCELTNQEALSPFTKPAFASLQEHPGSPLVERVLRDRSNCMWFRAEAFASYQCPGMPAPSTLPVSISRYDSSAHLEETANGSIFLLVSLALGRPGAFHVANTKNGIPSGLDTAMVARDGTIWLGTESGLYYFAHPFQIEYWNRDHGLESPYSLQAIGSHIFAGQALGLLTLTGNRDRWVTVPGTENLAIGALSETPGQTLLAASAQRITQLRPDGTLLARSTDLNISLPHVPVAIAPDGKMWAGGKGLSRVTRKSADLRLAPEPVPQEAVPDIQYDPQSHTLWACDGKTVIAGKEGLWRAITGKNGLMDANCGSLAIDHTGNLWLGYDTPAFALIKNPDSANPSVTNFTAGLDTNTANSRIHFIGVDKRGWLWRSADVLYLANPETAQAGRWLALGPADGFEDCDSSFFTDTDGSVWFNGQDRVTHVSLPADFLLPATSPATFVSGFSIGNAPPVLADSLRAVPHGEDITAHLASLPFSTRSSLRFRYRLASEQSSWIEQAEHDIHLRSLPWGNHKLEIQAQFGTAAWSSPASISFAVLKPVWLMWPALSGEAILFAAATLGAFRIKRKRAARAKMLFPDISDWRLTALSPELQGLEGRLLNARFEIGSVLARGGFATVIEGLDLRYDSRKCAVKIFRQECVDALWLTNRFRQEVIALEQLSHPNIVRIYGSGTTPLGAPFLVMEFVDGPTLREILETQRLSRPTIAKYLRQAGSALQEIHARGICHRDLKPENLMIRNYAAPTAEIVLIDFSIAIVKDPDQTIHGLSRAAGTLYYMAPEQTIGYADASSDIYSLAKILIEMLTGQRLSALLPDASIDLPDRLREFLARPSFDFSAASIDLLSQALEFDPLRRPRDAQRFANQIAQDLD